MRILLSSSCQLRLGVVLRQYSLSSYRKEKRRREEEAACMARPQKVQQQRRLVSPIQKKIQEYYGKWNVSPKGTLLLERGWITREMVAMYVNCRGYKGKKVQVHKNQGQGFLLEKQLRNVWCDSYQKAWNWREGEARRGEMTRVEYVKCRRRDVIIRKISEQERRGILCPECRIGRKGEWWNWGVVVWPTETKVQQERGVSRET